MNYKLPGILSLVLAGIALLIADFRLFTVSWILGLAYAVGLPLLFIVVFYGYCRKCPHVGDRSCRHVLPGWIVSKLFKAEAPAPYTRGEALLGALPLLAMFLFPQYWLIQNLILFMAFWIATLLTVISIRLAVCPGCQNTFCFFCPNKSS
jgi:hypothetical protein